MSDLSDYDEETGDSPTPSHVDDSKRHARAQHNALERRRRDNIKDMYNCLRDAVPDMNRERASRAQILKRAIEVIEEKEKIKRETNAKIQQVEEENRKLEEQINQLREELKQNDRLAPNAHGDEDRP